MAMLEEPLPREELSIVYISHIPAFILPSPFKHLGFYVGGRTEKTQVSFSPDINHSLRRKLRRCEEEKDATCSAP